MAIENKTNNDVNIVRLPVRRRGSDTDNRSFVVVRSGVNKLGHKLCVSMSKRTRSHHYENRKKKQKQKKERNRRTTMNRNGVSFTYLCSIYHCRVLLLTYLARRKVFLSCKIESQAVGAQRLCADLFIYYEVVDGRVPPFPV